MFLFFKSPLFFLSLIHSFLYASFVQAWDGDLPFGNDLGYFDCTDEQISRIGVALGNTLNLAAAGLALAVNNDRGTLNAYTHYFRTEYRNPPDHIMFEAAMNAAIAFIVPPGGVRPISWKIKCALPPAAACGIESRVLTEYEPNIEHPTMFICPKFHTSTDTMRTIQDKSICDSPNGIEFQQFETGGHKILHELTHFDGFGILAKMPLYTRKGSVPAHGTDDWKAITTPRNARELVNNPKNGIDTWRNAENNAAAATEYFFQNLCQVDDIPLSSGPVHGDLENWVGGTVTVLLYCLTTVSKVLGLAP